MLKGIEIATIIEAMGTSLDNGINPKRSPGIDMPKAEIGNRVCHVIPFEADPASGDSLTLTTLRRLRTGFS